MDLLFTAELYLPIIDNIISSNSSLTRNGSPIVKTNNIATISPPMIILSLIICFFIVIL